MNRRITKLSIIILLLSGIIIGSIGWYFGYYQPQSVLQPSFVSNEQESVVIPITGGANLVNLACDSSTEFKLSTGIQISVPKIEPCEYSFGASVIGIQEIPAKLPDGMSFVDGISITLINKDNSVDILPSNKKIKISFANDAKQIGTGFLKVYRWDPSYGWHEVSFDSRLIASSSTTGLFILMKY